MNEESRAMLRRQVSLQGAEALKEVPYTPVGIVQGYSCKNKMWDPPATTEAAVDQLRFRASALGGNAITGLVCDAHGTSVGTNCWESVKCQATALRIGEGKKTEATTTRKSGSSSGSGFVVDRRGHILTSQHVVQSCHEITAHIEGMPYKVSVQREDIANDLALLVATPAPEHFLVFREGKRLRAGEQVVAIGFPLSNLLSAEPHVTTGSVTALAGLKGDTSTLEISAPLQPGNSGGPLLDQSGHVVGVTSSKLDAVRMASLTGDIPQNVNFATNARVAESFLDANDVRFETRHSENILSTADLVEESKPAVVLLKCRR